jgi:hypothetical protein
MPKTLLTSRQIQLLKTNNWNDFLVVFNEVHNSTLTTAIGSVSIKTNGKKKNKYKQKS